MVSAKVQAKTMVEEANASPASSLPGAEAEAYRTIRKPKSYAQQLVAEAEGESTAFSALLGGRPRQSGIFAPGFTPKCWKP